MRTAQKIVQVQDQICAGFLKVFMKSAGHQHGTRNADIFKFGIFFYGDEMVDLSCFLNIQITQ